MKISNNESLRSSIIALEVKRELLLLEMKELVDETKESLKPMNLIKNAIHTFTDSDPEHSQIKKNLIGIGAGFLTNKLLFSRNAGIKQKLLGGLVQLVVTKLISSYTPGTDHASLKEREKHAFPETLE